MAGDFTPGANLSEPQIDAIMAFLATRGQTNEETLRRMRDWPRIARRIFLKAASREA